MVTPALGDSGHSNIAVTAPATGCTRPQRQQELLRGEIRPVLPALLAGSHLTRRLIWRTSRLQVGRDDGGHAVLLLGIDPIGRVVFRNSWGVDWGELGYGYMTVPYLMAHIQQGMTIGGVIAEPRNRWGQQPEDFDVRANAVPDNAGNYSMFVSLVLHGNWVQGGGITNVGYTLYPPDRDVRSPLTRPLGKLTGTRADAGFYERFDDIPYHSLQVIVSITHSDGSVVTGYRAVPDTVTWNPLPPTH